MKLRDFTKLPLWLAIVQAAAGVAAYSYLPARIPLHWGMTGVDRWGDKSWMHVLGMPLLTLALWLGMWAAPKFDPKGRNIERSPEAYQLIADLLAVFFTFMEAMLIVTGFRPDVPLDRFMPPAVGVLFVLLGNWMPKLPQNWTAGVKFPWTLDDPEVWRRTNRLGGQLFVAEGLVLIVLGLVSPPAAYVFLMVSAFAMVVGLVVYSYLQWRKRQESTPSA
jgi:uncharacterized membrane protein